MKNVSSADGGEEAAQRVREGECQTCSACVNAASGRRSAAAPLKPLPRPPPGFLSKALVMKLHHLCANAAVRKTEGGAAVQCGAQGPEAGSDSGRCGAWEVLSDVAVQMRHLGESDSTSLSLSGSETDQAED